MWSPRTSSRDDHGRFDGVFEYPTGLNLLSRLTSAVSPGLRAAGNLLSLNGNSAGYDAENRLAQVSESAAFGGSVETLAYDGSGRRVEKVLPNGTTVYVYDACRAVGGGVFDRQQQFALHDVLLKLGSSGQRAAGDGPERECSGAA
jgi:YD repeat-containing protein